MGIGIGIGVYPMVNGFTLWLMQTTVDWFAIFFTLFSMVLHYFGDCSLLEEVEV